MRSYLSYRLGLSWRLEQDYCHGCSIVSEGDLGGDVTLAARRWAGHLRDPWRNVGEVHNATQGRHTE